MRQITHVTIEGMRHEIPDLWLVGYIQTHRCTTIQACRAWHEQAKLEAAAREP